MKGLFVVGLENLVVTDALGNGEKVADRFRLTNDRAVVRKLLPKGFVELVGTLEYNSLNAPDRVIAYSEPELEGIETHEQANALVLSELGNVGMFLTYLWLQSDHAITMELGFLIRPVPNGLVVTRNAFPQSISTSRATRPTTSLSREALRAVRQRLRTVNPGIQIEPQPLTVGNIDRRQRSLYFVQAARQANDLGVKVANYCTALESLFGTDSAELTHRLSERVACFLELDIDRRLATYKQVKDGYGVRSKVVHGAGGKGPLERLAQTAEQMDTLLRRVLTRIYDDPVVMDRFSRPPSSDDERYFLALTLGGKLADDPRTGDQ